MFSVHEAGDCSVRPASIWDPDSFSSLSGPKALYHDLVPEPQTTNLSIKGSLKQPAHFAGSRAASARASRPNVEGLRVFGKKIEYKAKSVVDCLCSLSPKPPKALALREGVAWWLLLG